MKKPGHRREFNNTWAQLKNCVTWRRLFSGSKDKDNYYLSDSPSHLDMRSEDETEKNVELLASVATAFAMYDFPVPGGPNRRIPRHGLRLPTMWAMDNY